MSDTRPVQDADYYIGDFNPTDSEAVSKIKANSKILIVAMQEHCPPGRRLSAACTHVETAAMLAVKSLFAGA